MELKFNDKIQEKDKEIQLLNSAIQDLKEGQKATDSKIEKMKMEN